jgi:hypothetical protein
VSKTRWRGPGATTTLVSLLALSSSCRDATPRPHAPAPEKAPPSAAEPHTDGPDEQAIRTAFVGYRDAVLSRRGAVAAELVTADIFDYMDSMRTEALTATADHVRRKALMDKYMVLTFRARISLADLKKMTGRELFAHSVDIGMNGDSSRGLEPDAIEIDGDVARVGLRKDGQTMPPSGGFRFVKSGGAWRLDVMSASRLATAALPQVLKSIDPDPDRAILKLLELGLGKPVPATLWEPLAPAK